MTNKPNKLAISIIATTAMAASSIAIAQTDLRFASWLPASHPLSTEGFEPWMESIEEATNGSVTFTLYPAQQLGASADHHDMARDGISDLSMTNFSYTPGRFPIAGAAEIPFVISDPLAASGVYHDWYQEFGGNEVADAKVCMLFLQPTGAVHMSGEKVASPSDLDGLSMRPPNANVGRLFTNLGASNVQVSAPESREAIARGVADGIGFPWDSLNTFGINEVVDYHLDIPLYVNVFGIIMNQGTYNNFSSSEQQVIDEHCSADWSGRLIETWNKEAKDARQGFIDNPEHEVYSPSASEISAWVEEAGSLQSSWKDDVNALGVDADHIWKELERRLDAAGALYGN